jgi:hypothetical protein
VTTTSTRGTGPGRDAGTGTMAGATSGATVPGGKPRAAGSDSSPGRAARRHALTPAPTDPSNWLG